MTVIRDKGESIRVQRPFVARRKLPDQRAAFLVCQREFALVRAPLWVKTVGFNSCVVVTFFDPKTQIAMLGMVHFDLETEVSRSFTEVIIPRLRAEGCKLGRVEVRIIGGKFSSSHGLRRQIRDELMKPGQRMKIVEIDIIKKSKQGLIMDPYTGEAYDLVRPVKGDAVALDRLGKATEYLASGNSLIHDVSALAV